MVRADISKIIMHEDYNSQTTDYDFALLKLKTKIDWTATPHIRPVCLPSADAGDFTGDTAYVTGKLLSPWFLEYSQAGAPWLPEAPPAMCCARSMSR